MKIVHTLILLLIGVSIQAQIDSLQVKQDSLHRNNYFVELKTTIDPSVLIDEGNFNIKVEGSVHFNMSNHWRVNALAEVLTGHGGYYGLELGVGYSIPYKIGTWRFRIEPGFSVGAIIRPNMPTLYTVSDNGNVRSNEGFVGFSHSWNLRHQLQIGKSSWWIYIHNRVILRSDLHFEQELTYTPNEIPFYNIDNAIGLSYHFK